MADMIPLPIPDWGLRCPHCDESLAGLTEPRCSDCGEAIDLLYVLGAHRPIPDLGLACPECGYPLTGLTGSRCPECGGHFSIRELLIDESPDGAVDTGQLADPDDHHVKKREPVLTGRERPLPDLGLYCAECEHSLEGATADVCPECGLPFDLEEIIPEHEWVDVTEWVPRESSVIATPILYEAQIPYLVDNAGLTRAYGFRIPFASGSLRVPREFFFDTLHAFAAADDPPARHARNDWICPNCHESVPAGFEVCWNCNASHPDRPIDQPDEP